MTNTSTSTPTIVAVFERPSDAENAIADLERFGIARSQIESHTKSATGTTTTTKESEGGFMGWLKSLFQSDDERRPYDTAYNAGRTVVSATVTNQQLDDAVDILDKYDPVDLHQASTSDLAADQGMARAAATGVSGATTTSAAGISGTTAKNAAGAVPVVQEDIAIGKRTYGRGGVRVYSRLVEEPVEETVRLRDERAYVDRQPTDRPATEADLRAGAEQVIEVEELAEEPVVEKRARVVEDISVGKDVSEREETIRDTVRKTEVNVEPIEPGRATRTSPGSVEERRKA